MNFVRPELFEGRYKSILLEAPEEKGMFIMKNEITCLLVVLISVTILMAGFLFNRVVRKIIQIKIAKLDA